MNFSGTSQGKDCNFYFCFILHARMKNETKTEQNLQLVFYWSISKIKYIGRINSAKVKYPTSGKFYLFFFPAWNEAELMNAFKCWAKSIIS